MTRVRFEGPRCGRSIVAVAVLFLVFAVSADAQQRIIVHPNFIQRFSRNVTALPDFSTSVLPHFCTAANSCLRYLEDARCLSPSHTPIDSGGCMAGWITTDFYDSNARNGFVQDGYILHPTQVGIGTNLE